MLAVSVGGCRAPLYSCLPLVPQQRKGATDPFAYFLRASGGAAPPNRRAARAKAAEEAKAKAKAAEEAKAKAKSAEQAAKAKAQEATERAEKLRKER